MSDGWDELAVGLVIVGVATLYVAGLGRLAGPPSRSGLSELHAPELTPRSMRAAENKARGFYLLRRWFAVLGAACLVAALVVWVLG